MPPLARAFIKSGMLYLVAGFALGALLLLSGVVALPAVLRASQPVYFHLLMVGWITQLIFGVAFWMFPKLTREQPRGNERLGWLSFYCLNAGLLIRVIAEPWNSVASNPVIAWLLPLSAVLQLIGGWAFVANSWGRVKGK